MTPAQIIDILQSTLRVAFSFAVLLWFGITVFYGWKMVLGYLRRQPHHTFVFPFWRKRNGAVDDEGFPKIRDSIAAYWVWVVIPFCLFLMAYIPLFPSDINKAIASSTTFWVSTFGAIGSVLANYYFGKQLSSPSGPVPSSPTLTSTTVSPPPSPTPGDLDQRG